VGRRVGAVAAVLLAQAAWLEAVVVLVLVLVLVVVLVVVVVVTGRAAFAVLWRRALRLVVVADSRLCRVAAVACMARSSL
jgi:hypothetical protein